MYDKLKSHMSTSNYIVDLLMLQYDLPVDDTGARSKRVEAFVAAAESRLLTFEGHDDLG